MGNIAALINPEGPRKRRTGRSDIPPPPGAPDAAPKVGRSVVMIVVGLVIVIWAIASLIGG